jgi:hypothetical protein
MDSRDSGEEEIEGEKRESQIRDRRSTRGRANKKDREGESEGRGIERKGKITRKTGILLDSAGCKSEQQHTKRLEAD